MISGWQVHENEEFERDVHGAMGSRNLGRAGILVSSFLLVVKARLFCIHVCAAYSCSLPYRIIPNHVQESTFCFA